MNQENEAKKLRIFTTVNDFQKEDTNGIITDKRLIGFGSTSSYINDKGEEQKPNALQVLQHLDRIEKFLKANDIDPRKMPIILTGDRTVGDDGKERSGTTMVAKYFTNKYIDPETAQTKFINKLMISYGKNTVNPETGETEYAPSITATRGKNGYVLDSDKYINQQVKEKFIDMSKNIDSYGNSVKFTLGMNDKIKMHNEYPQLADLTNYIVEQGGVAMTEISFAQGRGAVISDVNPIAKENPQQNHAQNLEQQINKGLDR